MEAPLVHNQAREVTLSAAEKEHLSQCTRCQRVEQACILMEQMLHTGSWLPDLDESSDEMCIAYRLLNRVLGTIRSIKERMPASMLRKDVLMVIETALEATQHDVAAVMSSIPHVLIHSTLKRTGDKDYESLLQMLRDKLS